MDASTQPTIPGLFLRGTNIHLIALSEEHARTTRWGEWFNDEESTRFTTHHRFPNSVEAQVEFFRNEVLGSRDHLQLGIVEATGQTLIGVISLKRIDFLNRTAEIAVMIGEKQYRQVKYTLEAHRLLINHAFDQLNLNRIYGATLMKEWAELLCRTIGCKLEGTQRQAVFKNGAYQDMYMFGLLREEYTRLS